MFTILNILHFTLICIIILKKGVEIMDIQKTKKLNKQGIILAILHTVIILDLTLEFVFIH